MNPTQTRLREDRPRLARALAAAALCIVGAGVAEAQQLLWSTTEGYTAYTTSESQRHVPVNFDREVADDFHAVGQFSRILIDGKGCYPCTDPSVRGVYVRLYEWTANGPGALQHQEFVPSGSPSFIHDPNPYTLDITLAAPVAVTGWHFVAVQVEFDVGGVWKPSQAYRNNPNNMPVHRRDNLAGGVWEQDRFFSTLIHADMSFQIWGTSGGVPEITSLSHASHDRSGRLRVFGTGFGGEQLNSRLLIDGIPAFVTQWTSAAIVGYVPEGAALGPVDVVVEVGGTPSAPATLDVTARQPDGRVRWRFAYDEDLSYHRCGVASDGTVYLNDQKARLYSLSPDGGLNWIVDTLPGLQGLGVEGPVEVGDDGTIYVIADPLGPEVFLQAYRPDGSLRWQVVEPFAYGTVGGPSIGPDGNVYAVFHFLTGPVLGAVSVTPDGVVRWNNTGSPPLYEHGAIGSELAFGSATRNGPLDRMFVTVDRDGDPWLHAFRLSDGQQLFAVPRGISENPFQMPQTVPAAGSGHVYLSEFIAAGYGWGLQAFDGNDGARLWRFDPNIVAGMTPPSVAPDGTIYVAWDLARVSAVSPGGVERWRHHTGGIVTEPPALDAQHEIVVLSGQPTFGVPGWFKGLDPSDGALLWTVDLPVENGGNITPSAGARFSPDRRTAYAATNIPGQGPSNEYGYLYALDTGLGLASSFCLGDGTGGTCPCFNPGAPGHGCANQPGSPGALLTASGSVSVSAADLVLRGTHLEPNQFGLFFQGTATVNGGLGLPLGDGLLCVGGQVRRLKVTPVDGLGKTSSTIDLVAGGGITAGSIRNYQLWYRNINTTPCGLANNLSNALEITWNP